ncbi:hypothetical protein H9X85_06635 [Anaerotignum lactatifermentans]|uniref:Resolvase/invertase-type recombinase catalytic domain-containing protein n=1 Tax=Anaerotignum lactatifermentans TaxID=160404 RepID=A0ABS2G8C8_9FIRM|nr:hypothetical protein [Anaerotignum lactatifermentans]MBM6829314.1 hypothetical protein [Anaerotignum lactatifermentans]MBM6877445.1 hypothetical protein [Anaerotignum lactatifermentans]MBM6950891.1 hypothetical protein [Anaerotignum lactatifermentans]
MEKKITKIEPVRKQEQQNAPMMKRVCAYCRVSTASGEQKRSLEAQIRYYTKLIQEKEHWISSFSLRKHCFFRFFDFLRGTATAVFIRKQLLFSYEDALNGQGFMRTKPKSVQN